MKSSGDPERQENCVLPITEPGNHGDLVVKKGDSAHPLMLSSQQRSGQGSLAGGQRSEQGSPAGGQRSEQGSPAGGMEEEERLRELKLPPLRMPRMKSMGECECVCVCVCVCEYVCVCICTCTYMHAYMYRVHLWGACNFNIAIIIFPSLHFIKTTHCSFLNTKK